MTDDERKPPIVLSRDELYSQIWTTPMIRLAAQYGITGTGLAKICARLNVPCPPRGYKQRIQSYDFSIIEVRDVPIDVATEIFTRIGEPPLWRSAFTIPSVPARASGKWTCF